MNMCRKKSILCFFILTALILSVQTASAITFSASPNPAPMNKTVTFRVGVTLRTNPLGAPCSVSIDFGDGSASVLLGTVVTTTPTIFQTTHTYPRTGFYRARAYASCPALINPSEAYLGVRISDFEIQRMELLFENGRPQATLQRNAPSPGLTATINFSGSELVKGYWEVDGRQTQHFFKQLSIGPQIDIVFPKIPGLSTFESGSHVVRFVITQPSLDINFPKAVYYVTPESFIKVADIRFSHPGEAEPARFDSGQIAWEGIPETEVYMVHFFVNGEDKPVFSAYAAKNRYTIRPDMLAHFIDPQKLYQLQVEGYHADTRLTGKSRKIPVTLK